MNSLVFSFFNKLFGTYLAVTLPYLLFNQSTCFCTSSKNNIHFSLSKYKNGDGALFKSNSLHNSLEEKPSSYNALAHCSISFFSVLG